VDSRNIWQLYPEVSAIPRIPEAVHLDSNNLDEMVARVAENLLDYFSIIKENFGDSVCMGLSAGYDSRLVLALLKKAGIKPQYLYTYPDSRQPTCVERTKIMAKGEGLELDYVDVRKSPRVSREEFEAFIENQYYMNDGLVPVFDNGSSLAHRLERVDKAKLNLNGGSGEIYRNFWRLPQKNISVDGFVKSRYDVDFSMCTSRFNRNLYLSTFTDKIKSLLEITDNRLNEKQIAMLFPLWWVRYWMGHNNTINNQISYELTPFNDVRFALQSFDIPLKYRNYGIFQSRLIKYIDPDLARYTSHYGYNFYDPLPLKARIEFYTKLHVPVRLRAFIRRRFWNVNNVRLQLRKKQVALPFYLSTEYRDRIFANNDLRVSEYFNLDKIRDQELLSRVLSAELLISNRF
jgi:asparagine synthase (glutamine-hydrolysing)